MRFKRIFLMVLDSLGVGEAIDAINYGDTGQIPWDILRKNMICLFLIWLKLVFWIRLI